MVAVIGVLKLSHFSASTYVNANFPSILKHLMLNDSDTQEIWSAVASTSEVASREREALISKPVIYYLLNRYLAPEYTLMDKLTDKLDVYSYGFMLLELITERPPVIKRESSINESLLDWAQYRGLR